MKAVYALYLDPQSAQAAYDDLRAAGVGADDITVISSEPFEEYEFTRRHSTTWLPRIAGGGGAAGLAVGYWLTSMTETSWPLPTGGMSIVPMWPNLIVIFELTMLGAMLATVAAFLITAKMPGRAAPMYDREVADGKILVGVANPSDASLNTLEQALRGRGTSEVKTIN